MNAIYISKDGKLLAMNKPEKPRSECSGKGFNCCAGERCVLLVYSEVTLPSAISAAEKEQVEFKDRKAVTNAIMLDGSYTTFNPDVNGKLKEGLIFPCPSGFEIKVEEGEPSTPQDQTSYPSFKKVALLVRVEEKDIWEVFMDDWREASMSNEVGKDVVRYLKQKYTITTNKG